MHATVRQSGVCAPYKYAARSSHHHMTYLSLYFQSTSTPSTMHTVSPSWLVMATFTLRGQVMRHDNPMLYLSHPPIPTQTSERAHTAACHHTYPIKFGATTGPVGCDGSPIVTVMDSPSLVRCVGINGTAAAVVSMLARVQRIPVHAVSPRTDIFLLDRIIDLCTIEIA